MFRNQSIYCLPSDFLVTKALRPGANGIRVTVELNWDEASGIIGTHRAQNNEGLALLNLAKAKSVIHANGSGSNVE